MAERVEWFSDYIIDALDRKLFFVGFIDIKSFLLLIYSLEDHISDVANIGQTYQDIDGTSIVSKKLHKQQIRDHINRNMN